MTIYSSMARREIRNAIINPLYPVETLEGTLKPLTNAEVLDAWNDPDEALGDELSWNNENDDLCFAIESEETVVVLSPDGAVSVN